MDRNLDRFYIGLNNVAITIKLLDDFLNCSNSGSAGLVDCPLPWPN